MAGIRQDLEADFTLSSLLKNSKPALWRKTEMALGKFGGPIAVALLMVSLGNSDQSTERTLVPPENA